MSRGPGRVERMLSAHLASDHIQTYSELAVSIYGSDSRDRRQTVGRAAWRLYERREAQVWGMPATVDAERQSRYRMDTHVRGATLPLVGERRAQFEELAARADRVFQTLEEMFLRDLPPPPSHRSDYGPVLTFLREAIGLNFEQPGLPELPLVPTGPMRRNPKIKYLADTYAAVRQDYSTASFDLEAYLGACWEAMDAARDRYLNDQPIPLAPLA